MIQRWTKAVGGFFGFVGVGFVGTWALGGFNNALSMSLSADRKPVQTVDGAPAEDYVILELKLRKPGPTRIRLTEAIVNIEQAGAPVMPHETSEMSKAVSAKLTDDFKVMNMVPGDEIGYQTYFRVPHEIPIHVSVEITGRMKVLEFVEIAHLGWSSSVVVLPAS